MTETREAVMSDRDEAWRIVRETLGDGWGSSEIACGKAIQAALTAARREAFEEAARWHDREARELRVACNQAWAEVTPDLGLHAIDIHAKSAAAIRAKAGEQG